MKKMFFSLPNLLMALLLLAFYGLTYAGLEQGWIDDYYKLNLFLICINIILAVSLNVINGMTGQFSIGHAGFMAIGAYGSAVMTMKLGFPFGAALIVGAVGAALAGLIVGIPTLRLKGDYLAIATLGFGEIIRVIILNIEYVGGAAGLNGIAQYTNWHWIFFLTVATVLVIKNFMTSTHGRACIAIRENEIAAETMGVDITRYKVIAFTIGAFFAGLAGALHAHYFYTIQPTTFGFMKSFDILVFVVLGGLGSLTGSILSAIGLTVLSAFLQDYAELRMVIYSLLLIIVMLVRPQGLMGTAEFSYRGVAKLYDRLSGKGRGPGNDTAVG
ncbi:branched-chain amino acid ABC transporter permease [Heliophilum fasciatum]|uniref:Amino acid/amide ABC transporter membrane protein 2 (HAAT family) n=1 Tax=Heliophilum fasciatum TaxID=35700 RepID=A0A4R2RKY2_9FIRM|nr:branched-chain amino acid ABC transporter permease [Heliophilum fasciatum]MCW2278354.1 branched-chain amino acid transport system permease protein [Heliophilum fasciatum]TCP63773.1 amino acid/amide ABC transporter membrane protein 2 (HAAT family) [Heliophilum fasciatum]